MFITNYIKTTQHIETTHPDTLLYVRVSCFVVRGCGVSRRYIDVCYCDMFSVVNVYLDHLKFYVILWGHSVEDNQNNLSNDDKSIQFDMYIP